MITRTTGAQEAYVFQNSKKTLTVNVGGLQLAQREVYARIHNPGGKKGKNKDGEGYPSTVKFTAIEFGEGKDSKTVSFNLSPADVRLLAFKLERLRTAEFSFSADRLHSFRMDKATGKCPYLRLSIDRIPKNRSGEPYRSPWCVKITEGTAEAVTQENGSTSAKKGSVVEENTVTVMLSDDEYMKMILTINRAIELWEEAYAIPHILSGDIMVRIKQVYDSATNSDGTIGINADRAKNELIKIASAIVQYDVQTREVCKDYCDLVDYLGHLVGTDFSAFKLQSKKASK